MNEIATILVFSYNHEDYISKTLESILNQVTSYKYKIVVADDCSTDSTQRIVDSFVKKYRDATIVRHYNSVNLGINKNFETNIEQLDTKYVFLLGGDDYWTAEDKIEKQISIMESDSNISYIHTGFQYYDENTKSIGEKVNTWHWNMPQNRHKRILSAFVNDWSHYPLASTCVIRTSILQEGLQKYRSLLYSYVVGEGTFLNVSLTQLGKQFYFIPDITTSYTVRKNSASHYEDKTKLLRYKFNYIKEQIHTCELLGIDWHKEIYFQYYNLYSLLDIAYSNNINKYYLECINEDGYKLNPLIVKIMHISAKYPRIMGINRFVFRVIRKLRFTIK